MARKLPSEAQPNVQKPIQKPIKKPLESLWAVQVGGRLS